MAFITLSGTLLDPNGDLAVGDQVRFTHKSTTGETVEGAVSIITINPAGTYSLPLQYGFVLVEYKDVKTQQFKNLGVATVNGTNPATTIPELLNALVPVSSAELIEFQAILADCVTAQTAAENAATTAEAFAYQLTTVDLIASTAAFAANTNIPTSGFTTSGDGGNGSWKQNGITAQAPSQSPAQLGNALLNDGNGNQWELITVAGALKKEVHVMKLGALESNADNALMIQAAINSGGVALIPVGEFNHSGLSIQKGNFALLGKSRSTSKLIYTETTGNDITIGDMATTYSNVYIEHLWMGQKTGVERLSGAKIQAYNFTHSAIRSIYFTDGFKNIRIDGAARSEIVDTWYRVENGRVNPQDSAIDMAYNNTTSLSIVNLKIIRADGAGATGYLNAFFKIDAADWILIDQCHTNKANFGMIVDHKHSMNDVWVANTYFDEAVNVNVKFIGGVAESFKNIKFSNTYFRLPGTRNVSFENTSLIRNVSFTDNCIFAFSGTHAIYQETENINFLRVSGADFENNCTVAGNVIESKSLRTSITDSTFDNTTGSFDVSVSIGVLSGSVILTGNNFAASASVAKTNISNVSVHVITDNVALPNELVPLLEQTATTSVTTDGLGQATIPHGLGVVPSFATADLYNATTERAGVVSLTSTDIIVRLYDEVTNADLSGVTRNVRTLVKA